MVDRRECDCSGQGDMTERTPIVNSVHTSNDSLQKRRVSLTVVSRIESDCSEEGDTTELTKILNSVHTSFDSFQRRREPPIMVTSIESNVTSKVTRRKWLR
jgi:hypothetical protein